MTDRKGINGAASMLYENELHELAESLESDLYSKSEKAPDNEVPGR